MVKRTINYTQEQLNWLQKQVYERKLPGGVGGLVRSFIDKQIAIEKQSKAILHDLEL
jgi:hypothetical protein